MKRRQKIVLATAAIALFCLFGAGVYKTKRSLLPYSLDVRGQPVIGEGSIEIVVFEDFSCINCRIFTEQVAPHLIHFYVDTGKARLILIPVSFTEQSKPLANAALAVYRLTPKQFWPFVKLMSLEQPMTKEEILQVAYEVGDIPLDAFSEKMETDAYYEEIDHNLVVAQELMGDDFGTPTILMNGLEVPMQSVDVTLEKLTQQGPSS